MTSSFQQNNPSSWVNPRRYNEHDNRFDNDTQYNRRGRGGQPWRGNSGMGRKSRGYRGGQRGAYQNRSGGRGGREKGVTPRSRLEDEDVDMDGGDSGADRRYNPYSKGGRGSRSSRGGYSGRVSISRLPVNDRRRKDSNLAIAWSKVVIPFGEKCDKQFILKSITDLSELPFVPHKFRFDGKNAVFFVQDRRVANAIRAVSKRITMPNGYKMVILTYDSSPPVQELDDETVEKLKLCMSNRYEPPTKHLDLSGFGKDKDLSKDGIFLPLSRVSVFHKIVSVIEENIPEVESMNLAENRLYNLDSVSIMSSKLKNLKKLNLSNNGIKSEFELKKIEGLKLVEIILEKNPMCNNIKEHTAYISAVRKRFPKVLVVDGQTLPPPITFDISTSNELPKTLGSHFPDDNVKNLVIQFLEQYYQLFDSEDRQSLLDAYHDQAMFSVIVTYNKLEPQKQASFSDYIQHSRNLLRVSDTTRKDTMLKQGKLNIVTFLCRLPKTQHDPNSVTVDVNIVTPGMMVFTVTGVFKEIVTDNSGPQRVRSFSRTFVTVPQGSGIVITNEQFTLINASADLIKKSFRPVAAAPTPSPSPQPQTTPTSPIDQHAEMVRSFSQQSGMNADWSMKCLAQNNWNYETAAKVFADLNEKGAIPPEAFVK